MANKNSKKSTSTRVSTKTAKSKAQKTQSEKSTQRKAQSETPSKANKADSTANKHIGEIWRGETKYIDPEPKKQRDYVVVIDDGKRQTVSKVKSIKIFDENGKNADKALVEINATRYGLEQRSGVDMETFKKNRMSGKPLKVSDKRVFPEKKPRGKLGSHDTNRVLRHTRQKPKNKERKK